MKSAQSTTDRTAPEQATHPSFDLSSYVAVSRAPRQEAAPQTTAPGAVAFCTVGTLALVPLTSAHAAIQTKANTGNMNTIDMGGDGVSDFTIWPSVAGSSEYFWRRAAAPANRVGSAAYRSTTNKTVGNRPGMVNPAYYYNSIYQGGALRDNFQAGTDNYVPVKFADANINGGSTVYGWAQIDAKNDSDIVKVVYSDAGHLVNLNGGAFSEVIVPEPCTLALMATGAAGVLALRRRRREGKRKA